ncbi:MAG: response regulator transcription factor [Bacteroidetes bacterium]|nr:response regulator transcription factor [Bacteroidota bacterium]
MLPKKSSILFRPKKTHPRLSELSERGNEILQLVATGLIVKEVAHKLHLSNHTVTKHVKNIYNKLHVNNRIEAVNKLNHPEV